MFCHRQIALGLCVGAHLVLGAAAAAAQDWRQYRNERYGFTLQYPADLFVTERAAEAGDGQVFASSDDDARLLVGALPMSPATRRRPTRNTSPVIPTRITRSTTAARAGVGLLSRGRVAAAYSTRRSCSPAVAG